MKKILPVMMLSGVVVFGACGNKTEQAPQSPDSLVVADTVGQEEAKVDTPQVAEPEENAAVEEKALEKKGKSVQAGGVTITEGEPLAATLRKAKNVSFDYSADHGLNCNIGNVHIAIPDEDITKAGQDFVNALLSDIEPDIDFKIDYIKPSAKIKSFEVY